MRALQTFLALAGVVFAVLAASRNDHRMGWIAMGLVICAIALRLIDKRRQR